MTTPKGNARANGTTSRPQVGGARPSQMMFAYGVGAQVDLPSISVVVAGLDAWDKPREHVVEPRLLAAVRDHLGDNVRYLAALPWIPESASFGRDESRFVGVPVLPFPRWMRCTICNRLSTCDGGQFTLKANMYRPQRTRYVHEHCLGAHRSSDAQRKKPKFAPTVVPVRFVLACANGHLDDFPWFEFVHGFRACSKLHNSPGLEMFDVGSGMRSTDVTIKCLNCDASAAMSSIYARDETKRLLPKCRGRNVHLRSFDPHGCSRQASPMLLGASNMWFPMSLSALALPSRESDAIDRLVETLWGHLSAMPVRAVFDYAVNAVPELSQLTTFSGDDVWNAIERRRAGEPAEVGPVDLKAPEWEWFIDPSAADAATVNVLADDFDIRARTVPRKYSPAIEAVTAAVRLRSVVALVGFARVEAPDSGADLEIDASKRVRLSDHPPSWVPATEMRGEGLFIRLSEERLSAWTRRVSGSERIVRVVSALADYRPASTPRFLLLHSLSHLIVNGVALDCGYSAASIRERIYSADTDAPGGPMAGILLYTAAPDAEGTLGGLVSLAEPERFERILDQSLERAMICASDPMCAEHLPSENDPSRHGAACHACLFLPETSCECGNRYLDRSVLQPTLVEKRLSYFAGD